MKKLNLYQAENQLISTGIKIFSPRDLMIMFDVSQRAAEGFLSYNLKKGAFIRLKKGFYSLKRNWPSDFFLANKIYSPSYVSLDTALAFYHLIPETVYAVTSVTTKATRRFEIKERLFEYRKIKKEAYAGYQPTQVEGEVVFLATPEKAVADFLYFVWLGKRKMNDRLVWEKLDLIRLKQYLKLFGQKRLVSFAHQLEK